MLLHTLRFTRYSHSFSRFFFSSSNREQTNELTKKMKIKRIDIIAIDVFFFFAIQNKVMHTLFIYIWLVVVVVVMLMGMVMVVVVVVCWFFWFFFPLLFVCPLNLEIVYSYAHTHTKHWCMIKKKILNSGKKTNIDDMSSQNKKKMKKKYWDHKEYTQTHKCHDFIILKKKEFIYFYS